MKKPINTTTLSVVVLLSFSMLHAYAGSGSRLSGILEIWHEGNSGLALSNEGTAISTATELKSMTADGVYHLTAHIDLNEEAWTALHSKDAPFIGTLRGDGYIIYNLNIEAPDANYQGLFAALSGATINDLGIGVRNIIVGAVAGSLAGYVDGTSSLTNIAVAPMTKDSKIVVGRTSNIDDTSHSYAGGIVGYLASGELTDGFNEGLAVRAIGDTRKSGTVGGLVGSNDGIVTGSSSGDVSSNSGNRVGGLVGSNSGQVTGSSSGDVNSESGNDIGGLAGITFAGYVTGSSSGDVRSVSGHDIGGLVGWNGSTVTGSVSGDVSSESGDLVGGLVGINLDSAIGFVSGDVSSVSGNQVGGLAGANDGMATGFVSGTVSSVSGNRVGGLVGFNSGQATGVAMGWVMVESTNVDVGAVVGYSSTSILPMTDMYYNSDGGDHVGTTDSASENRINEDKTGATGNRGTNGLGTGIDGIAHATATNMPLLTEGTAVGEWTFTAGEWPRINLPDSVTDYADYTTSPPRPANFFD